MRAIWRDTVLAESPDTIVVENNHYFPADSLRREYFRPSATHTTCGWKGEASYYTVEVNGERKTSMAGRVSPSSPPRRQRCGSTTRRVPRQSWWKTAGSIPSETQF